MRIAAKSEALARAASALMPNGLLPSFSRWDDPTDRPMFTGSSPVFAKGHGAILTDVDGNEYIDYIGGHGALILGHGDERVVAAISKAASKGCGFGVPSEAEIRLVELIVGRFPSIDMVQLAHTSADALNCAVAVARDYTGREVIATFEGYPFSGGEPSSSFTLPYSGIDATQRLFREHGSSIAAVVVEPVGVSTGLIPPADRFLNTLRTLCDAHGALLIFDEALSGLRVAPGGAAALCGVTPDLTVLGPMLGGGLPLGACAGSKEVMKHAGAAGAAGHLGPASGNLIAMAAGIATLQAIGEPGFYQALEQKAARLEDGLRVAAQSTGVPTYHTRVASILGMFFSRERITQAASARRCDASRFARFHETLLDRGVLLPPSPFSCIFISAAHTDDEIDRTIEAARQALTVVGD
jgi:glutamate-1-semialdehyde 2,1-aminomutase